MNKKLRKILASIIAGIIMSVSVMTASMACSKEINQMGAFPTVRDRNPMDYSGYTYSIQRKMLLYNGNTWQALGGKVDGVWGPKTKAAVVTYQRNRGLKRDGIVGKNTWISFGNTCDVKHYGNYVHFFKKGNNYDKVTEKYGSKWYTWNSRGGWFSYR